MPDSGNRVVVRDGLPHPPLKRMVGLGETEPVREPASTGLVQAAARTAPRRGHCTQTGKAEQTFEPTVDRKGRTAEGQKAGWPRRAIVVGMCGQVLSQKLTAGGPLLSTKRSLDGFPIDWHRPCVRLVWTEVAMPLLNSRG